MNTASPNTTKTAVFLPRKYINHSMFFCAFTIQSEKAWLGFLTKETENTKFAYFWTNRTESQGTVNNGATTDTKDDRISGHGYQAHTHWQTQTTARFISGWARSESVREHVTDVALSLAGRDITLQKTGPESQTTIGHTLSLKTESCHYTNLIVVGISGSCRYDMTTIGFKWLNKGAAQVTDCSRVPLVLFGSHSHSPHR